MDEKAIARFQRKVDRRGPDDCWPWKASKDHLGYGRAYLGKPAGAHRVAFFIQHGHWPVPEGRHTCAGRYPAGDVSSRSCCNPAHIIEGTHAQNMADMRAHGRAFGGMKGKLTPEQVRESRALRGLVGQLELAHRFNVSKSTVSRAQTGYTWKDI